MLLTENYLQLICYSEILSISLIFMFGIWNIIVIKKCKEIVDLLKMYIGKGSKQFFYKLIKIAARILYTNCTIQYTYVNRYYVPCTLYGNSEKKGQINYFCNFY